MNNNILQTIFVTVRATAVFFVAFFAFVSDAFAAPALSPVAVRNITENSATIVGHVSNQFKTSTVWFEFYNGSGAPTSVALQGLYGEGTFEWNLRDLNPGQTYQVRGAAMEGGTTVYSPLSSFITAVPKDASMTVSYQSNSSATMQSPIQTFVSKTIQPKAQTVAVKQATVAPPATKEGFTNGYSASVIGADNNMFPSTLIGWLLLIVLLLAAITVGHMLYEAPERRRIARAKKRKSEEEEEMGTA